MKIWSALIVDDELPARMELKRMLEAYPMVDVRGEAGSMQEAQEAIAALNPDLLFLDIDLGSHSGFDLLERAAPTFRVIFITAYDAFAIRAFRVNALDYLLKPVHPERLRESIERLGNPFHHQEGFRLEPFDRILVSHQKFSRLIPVQSISYIEDFGDYSRIHARDGFTGTLHHTMKRWTERLPGTMFRQVHRSFIVNMDRVSKLVKKNKESYVIHLDHPEVKIPVSRSYSRLIKDAYRLG